MLNFRNTNILFTVLLFILIGYDLFYYTSYIAYAIIVVLYILIIFYGCYFVNSGFFIDVLCAAKTEEKVIAITFDDGPSNEFTPAILEVLKETGVQAAFFCIGSRIASSPQLIKKIHEENHIIGNHTNSHHVLFDLFPTSKMYKDMELMSYGMKEILGIWPKLFRPPYGVTNPNLRTAIINGNYTSVGWSVRSMDTVIKDKNKLLNKINRSLQPGAVYLFHDTCRVTLDVLPAFIMNVKQRGYKIVRLDHMLNIKAYA